MSECKLNKFAMFALLRPYRRMNSMLLQLCFNSETRRRRRQRRPNANQTFTSTTYAYVCIEQFAHKLPKLFYVSLSFRWFFFFFIYLFFFRNSLVPSSKSCCSRLYGICLWIYWTRRARTGIGVGILQSAQRGMQRNKTKTKYLNFILAALMNFEHRIFCWFWWY